MQQMTLLENTGNIPTQRRANPTIVTVDQTAKEKTPGFSQTEKGRITRQTGKMVPTTVTMGDIPDAETG